MNREQLLQALRAGIDEGVVTGYASARNYLIRLHGSELLNAHEPLVEGVLSHDVVRLLGYKDAGLSWETVDRAHSVYAGGRWAGVRLLPRAGRTQVRKTPQARGQVRHAPRRTRRSGARAPARLSDDPSPRRSRLARLLRALARSLWGTW